MILSPINLYPENNFHSLIKEIFPGDFERVIKTWNLSKSAKEPLFQYYIAFENDKPVGITGHYNLNDRQDKMFLGWFGIAPGYRKFGYGTKILKETEKLIVKLGFNRLNLWCEATEDSSPAHSFYFKNGYKIFTVGKIDDKRVLYFRKDLL